MTKYSNKKSIVDGGRQRSIEAMCGYTVKAQLDEANRRMRVHIRNCKICSKDSFMNSVKDNMPKFNSDIAVHNGYNGVKPNLSVANLQYSIGLGDDNNQAIIVDDNQTNQTIIMQDDNSQFADIADIFAFVEAFKSLSTKERGDSK